MEQNLARCVYNAGTVGGFLPSEEAVDKQLQKTAVVAAASAMLIVLAFVLGIKVVGTSNSPEAGRAASEPVAETQTAAAQAAIGEHARNTGMSQDAIVDQLTAVEGHLQEALNRMNRATLAGKGDYVQKSRQDLAQAVGDISSAIDYARNHPEIAQLPAPESKISIPTYESVSGGRTNVAPNLKSALNELQPALSQLQSTPGGDFGHFRDRTLADIQQAATDIAAGVTMAAGGGDPGAAVPVPPANMAPSPVAIPAALSPTPTPDKYKPLRFAPSPGNGSDLVLAAAQRSLPVRYADINDPKLREFLPPFRYFLLNPQQLGDALAMESLQDNGFEYFIRLSGTIIGQSDVRAGANGDFRSMSIGTGSNRLPEIDPALAALAADEKIKKGSYEARLLATNPPTPLYALWLVSDNGAPDLVYPMIAPTGIQPHILYSADDFIKAFKASPKVQRR